MNRDIRVYIEDILDIIGKTEGFIKDMDFETFAKDEKTIFAVERCLEIIGEAAKHVPIEMRQNYGKIPWRDMAGMRDRVIHFYFGVVVQRVWLVITEDIPAIKPLIEEMLSDLKEK